jgi:hypothetical protein
MAAWFLADSFLLIIFGDPRSLLSHNALLDVTFTPTADTELWNDQNPTNSVRPVGPNLLAPPGSPIRSQFSYNASFGTTYSQKFI